MHLSAPWIWLQCMESLVNLGEDIRVFCSSSVFLPGNQHYQNQQWEISWLAMYENNADKRSHTLVSLTTLLAHHWNGTIQYFQQQYLRPRHGWWHMEDVKNENNKMLTTIVLGQNKEFRVFISVTDSKRFDHTGVSSWIHQKMKSKHLSQELFRAPPWVSQRLQQDFVVLEYLRWREDWQTVVKQLLIEDEKKLQ